MRGHAVPYGAQEKGVEVGVGVGCGPVQPSNTAAVPQGAIVAADQVASIGHLNVDIPAPGGASAKTPNG